MGRMGDSSGASGAAARRVQSSQQGGVFRRLFELMVMMVSALLVIFAWDTAGKAREESAQLRLELRRAKKLEAERTGTRCTVCLDNPREVLLQPCGHVVRPLENLVCSLKSLICFSVSAWTAPRGLPALGTSVRSVGKT